MSATAAAKTAPAPEPKPLKEIERARIEEASIGSGPLMKLTLPDDETLSEGPQDIFRFGGVATDLNPGQWLEVGNDADSFYGLFRVVQLLGTRNTGCRGLVLQAITPPRHFDRKYEAPVATGSWYTRWGGSYLKWIVISPNGSIFRQHLMSEGEAQHHVLSKMTSARPL